MRKILRNVIIFIFGYFIRKEKNKLFRNEIINKVLIFNELNTIIFVGNSTNNFSQLGSELYIQLYNGLRENIIIFKRPINEIMTMENCINFKLDRNYYYYDHINDLIVNKKL